MPSWYEALDAALGGILPGGVSLGTPFGSTLAEAAAPGGVAAAAPVLAPAAGRPAVARGRIVTVKQRVFPDGSAETVSITPGGVALHSRDLTAYNKVVKIARRISPAKRARKGPVRRKRRR